MTRIEVLAPAHLSSLRALFEAAGSACFCRYWHFTGTKNEWLDRCANRPDENEAEMRAALEADDGTARGLVALRADVVVGWMKLTARTHLAKLRALPVYRNLDLGDPTTTFGIGCFLIHPDARDQGVARALVEAAPAFARTWGASAIEAYPRRSAEPLHAEEAWQGPEELFVANGFEPVHDVPPYPVYRRSLP